VALKINASPAARVLAERTARIRPGGAL